MSRTWFQRTGMMAALAISLVAAGCGGGGGSGVETADSAGAGIDGSVTKGPVSHATVTAYAISGGQVGPQIGTATTDASGHFTMSVGGHAGPLMLKASGGTYQDEATGASMAMAPGDVMTALMASVVAGTNSLQITPLTAMAQALAQQMAGGMTEANIAAANAAMGNYFSVSDILHVHPMNPLTPGAGTAASQDARNYGMTLAAMSQYAKTLNMSVSSSMVTAMMSDASDGTMDGRKAGTQITMGTGAMMGGGMMASSAGTGSLAASMSDFMSSTANMSGLMPTDMAALLQKLTASSGKI